MCISETFCAVSIFRGHTPIQNNPYEASHRKKYFGKEIDNVDNVDDVYNVDDDNKVKRRKTRRGKLKK